MTRSKLSETRAAENSPPSQLPFFGRLRLTEPRSEAARSCTAKPQGPIRGRAEKCLNATAPANVR
jgi:hypothetical protein